MDEKDNEMLDELFKLLTSKMKRDILEKLYSKPRINADLARELGTNDQDIGRHISRMKEFKLVRMNSKDVNALTSFGESILRQLPNFSFQIKHMDYFHRHPLNNLPPKSILGIGALSNGTIIDGFVRVQKLWMDIYQHADEYVYAIKSQVSLDMIKQAFEAVNRGVDYKYILPENVIVPNGRSELLERLKWKKLCAKEKIDRRMLESTPVSVILNEKEASVVFPDLNCNADISYAFFSEHDETFHQWCLDYFHYLWNESNEFDERMVCEK